MVMAAKTTRDGCQQQNPKQWQQHCQQQPATLAMPAPTTKAMAAPTTKAMQAKTTMVSPAKDTSGSTNGGHTNNKDDDASNE